MHASVWKNASLRTSEASRSDKILSLFSESDKIAATFSGKIL